MTDALGIIGIGQTPYRRRHPDLSAGELVRVAVTEALTDARIEPDAIDCVIGAVAPDALSGVADIDKAAISLPGKPYLHVHTGGASGASALLAAKTMINAGRADVVLVVALERMGQATTAQSVFNTIFDPIYEKDFVLTTITMAALRATMLMKRYGFTGAHWAGIASRNFTQATLNPLVVGAKARSVQDVLDSPVLAWPIHLYEACPMSEGACAVVVARGDLARSRSTAWIHGTAGFSDTYAMGDRMNRPEGSLIEMVPLRRAAEQAYREAGVTDPAAQIDVLELQAPFAIIEAMAYPALGLCPLEGNLDFVERAITGDIPLSINPSGGAQAANPVSATALVRIAEAALQVRGLAGQRQVDGARLALATGQGGATQFSTVCVLGSETP
ncbi:thiolase family protein [Streptomyces sp. NPDC004629]|uniref:thiolase family protein n=1 Tax=Streptomyces sp. NPDC004629 TaxID=3364705 RepID=UPI0036BC9D4C